MKDKDAVIINGGDEIGFQVTAYLPGVKAAVTMDRNSRDFMKEPAVAPVPFNKDNKAYLGAVPWGDDNNLPALINDRIYKNPVVSSGILFNVSCLYGDGVKYGSMKEDKGKFVFVERNDVAVINEFFEENDISKFHLEQCTDIAIFYNIFPEFIFNREINRKIVALSSKEASFSRLEVQNAEGVIGHHFYSAKWGGQMDNDKDMTVTPVLDTRWPLRDLKIRMGLIADDRGNKKDLKEYRYVLPINIPTPGRTYYQKPYWYSIFESGWYDYACKIPEFKNALLDNQMVIKYHVELADDYFQKIFSEEGITEDDAKKARIKKEFTELNKFLANHKNSGKSVISFVKYSPDGKEMHRMKINVIENHFKGGEYLDDSEEASNIMSYGMGVHPSLIGSAPGKAKTINGTEARELWIIKQALMKPLRDRLLMPYYLIKAINEWPKDIVFAIPNMQLTTLDKGTGSEKVIS